MEKTPRKLLLFGTGECAMLHTQVEIFSHFKSEMKERDIVIEQFCLNQQNKNKFTTWKVPFDSSFKLLLIGRDGGEKFRSCKVVSAKVIFDIVDAMPMRIQEIKNNPK